MAKTEAFTDIRSLLGALAKTMNLVNSEIEHHHEQTAYLTYGMCHLALDMSEEDTLTAVYAALLHDVGSVVIEQKLNIDELESNAFEISQTGAQMLSVVPGFERIAEVIKYCQCSWQAINGIMDKGDDRDRQILQMASIIHLADSVSALLDPEKPPLIQAGPLRAFVREQSGKHFCPEAADAFLQITQAEFVWLDVLMNPQFLMIFTGEIGNVSLEEAVESTRLISQIIDYRSPFTAMHSAGVAACAKKLAQLSGMTREECMMMEIAGNVHDIGKLSVPRAILEKPGKLTKDEFNIMKEHAYYTRLVLMDVPGFERIANWAGFHHEKLNGNGYPFRFSADQLDLGSRIMAVADIFSAVTEERPYRDPMPREKAIAVLREDAERGDIDDKIVQLLIDHYDEVDAAREASSRSAGRRYFESLG